MQKGTLRAVLCTAAAVAVLLVLLFALKTAAAKELTLDDGFVLSVQSGLRAMTVSFRGFAAQVRLRLPRRTLAEGQVTGALNYLSADDCETANWQGGGIQVRSVCKTGDAVDSGDLNFTAAQFRDSLTQAGYDLCAAGYENHRSDSGHLYYTLEFPADTSWIYYYNYVDLAGAQMVTLVVRIDTPTKAERQQLQHLLDGSSFSAYSQAEIAQRAGTGDARLQFYLGLCCYAGNGTAKDDAAAFAWICQAASGGYRPAELYRGYFIFNGIGTATDRQRGREILQALADSGYEPAGSWLTALGELSGQEIPKA